MKDKKAPEATVSPHTETSNLVPSIISSSSPPTDCSTISATLPSDSRAKEGTTFNKTSSGQSSSGHSSILIATPEIKPAREMAAAAEPVLKMAATTMPRHVTAAIPESCKVTAGLPESSQVTATL